MPQALQAIEPIIVREKPPLGSRQVGTTPDGRIVYERTLIRGDNQPRINPETGLQEYAKHPTTGEPLYGKRKLTRIERVQVFTLEQDGQANLYCVDYTFPTPEELAEKDLRAKSAEMMPRLTRAIVQRGLTPDEFVARVLDGPAVAAERPTDDVLRLLQQALSVEGLTPQDVVADLVRRKNEEMQRTSEPAETAAVAIVEPEATADAPTALLPDVFPQPRGPGRWELSSGEVLTKSTRIQAQAAENALHAEASVGDEIPEQ